MLLSDSSFFQLFNYEFVIGYATKALIGFSNRIDIGASVFALAAMLSVCIAICTLVFQSLKVSKTNPVDTFRNE